MNDKEKLPQVLSAFTALPDGVMDAIVDDIVDDQYEAIADRRRATEELFRAIQNRQIVTVTAAVYPRHEADLRDLLAQYGMPEGPSAAKGRETIE